jgi:branched-chain amino acid transport system substrate-binding protein
MHSDPQREPLMIWRRAVAASVAVLTALIIAAPPSLPARAAPTKTLRIATQSPLSGVQASLGDGIRSGAQLAVDRRGGVVTEMGFSVEVRAFDDQAKPDVGVANAKTLAADEDVVLIVGHLNSAVAIPASEVYDAAGVAMISPANTDPALTERGMKGIFRVVGRDDAQGAAGAAFAAGHLRVRSAFILHDTTPYGRGAAESFRRHALRVGLAVLGFEGLGEQAGFGPVITMIQTRSPDLVYFGGLYGQAAEFFKQARAAGVKAAFMGPDGLDSAELVRIAGGAVVGAHYSAIAGPVSAYPAAALFAKVYREKVRKDPPPFAAQAYDATAIGLEAIAQAVTANGGRKPSREQVTTAIRQTRRFPGLTGTFAFDTKGDAAPATYLVRRVLSADPAKWSGNQLVVRLGIQPPGGGM